LDPEHENEKVSSIVFFTFRPEREKSKKVGSTPLLFLTSSKKREEFSWGPLHFLTNLKLEMNPARYRSFHFNELGMRKELFSISFVSFFNELGTRKELCSFFFDKSHFLPQDLTSLKFYIDDVKS